MAKIQPQPFEEDVSDEFLGFLPETVLAERTRIMFQEITGTFIGQRSLESAVEIGHDYSGRDLPKGTEYVRIVDLADGTQLVRYGRRVRESFYGPKGPNTREFKQEVYLDGEKHLTIANFLIE